MANYKVVISDPKSKKAFQKEIEQKASGFMGKRIGDKVTGDGLGYSGYDFQVTGGSDAQGFPMRKDVEGTARRKVLLTRGTGFKTKVKGQRKRRSVRGNTISAEIAQINVKILKYGSKPLEELSAKKEKKAELSEEEKKAKLQEELGGMVSKEGPAKSRSDQIREEMEAKEKAEKGGAAPKEEKPSEEKKEEAKPEVKEEKPEPAEEKKDDKPSEEPKKEEKKEKKPEEGK